MKLKICKLHPDATVPTYAHGPDACFDLYACEVMGAYKLGANLDHGHPVDCGTGLAFDVPEGWAMLVFSRSGHGFKHGIRLANCVGVIDSGYTGEVRVKLVKDYDWNDENEPGFLIKPGDRIAQAMLVQVPRVEFEVVEQLTLTERGEGGFGSSGAA
jgi:dUTP pyrophosphatase